MSPRHLIFTIVTAIAATSSTVALAAEAPACGKLSKEIVESGRNFRVCVTGPAAAGVKCGPSGMDLQEFINDKGRLVKARMGQVYYEGKVILPTDRSAGTKRWVVLSQKIGGKASIIAEYYSPDHYETFCRYAK